MQTGYNIENKYFFLNIRFKKKKVKHKMVKNKINFIYSYLTKYSKIQKYEI